MSFFQYGETLTGYAGGIEKKKALLNLEKSDMTHLKMFEK